MKKIWSFGYRVREWFLTPQSLDQIYEPGDHREVVKLFHMETSDEDLAIQHMIERAEALDIKLEILGLEFKAEQEVSVTEQPKLDWNK